MIEVSDGSSQKARENLSKRAQASSLEGLQRDLQMRLDGDAYALGQVGKNDAFDSALLEVVVNMQTVAQANRAMEADLPAPTRRSGSLTHIEEFPENLLASLTRMNRDAKAIGVTSFEDPITLIKSSK